LVQAGSYKLDDEDDDDFGEMAITHTHDINEEVIYEQPVKAAQKKTVIAQTQ
jgi:hypothetical protein